MAENKNNKQTNVATEQPAKKDWDPNRRYWRRPKDRGKKYADERKMGFYSDGDKKGQELSEYDKGVRSGYLQCQSDHTGLYTYKTVADETQGTNNQKKAAGAAASRDKNYWKKRKAAKQQNN